MELILAALRGRQARKMSKNGIPAEKLAAFLDGRLSEEERAGIEAVLADDPAGRAELIATSRLISEVERPVEIRSRYWKPWIIVAGAAAAATIAIVAVPDARNTGDTPVASERVAPGGAGGRVTLLSPSDTSVADESSKTFRWSSSDSATYRITVADETGQTVWTALTVSTQIILPDSVKLIPGRRHFWYVDAVFHDGSSVTSGPRVFTTAQQ